MTDPAGMTDPARVAGPGHAGAPGQVPVPGHVTDPVGHFFETFGEASRRLAHSRIEQRIAEAHGLDLLAFRLMLHVRAEGARVGDLARKVVAYASHTSRAVAVLESRGYVTRATLPEDGRVVLVRPTPEGMEVSRTLRGELLAALAERVAGWSDEDLAAATVLLRRLADAL